MENEIQQQIARRLKRRASPKINWCIYVLKKNLEKEQERREQEAYEQLLEEFGWNEDDIETLQQDEDFDLCSSMLEKTTSFCLKPLDEQSANDLPEETQQNRGQKRKLKASFEPPAKHWKSMNLNEDKEMYCPLTKKFHCISIVFNN